MYFKQFVNLIPFVARAKQFNLKKYIGRYCLIICSAARFPLSVIIIT